MTQGNLHFIVSHGPTLQKDHSVRTLIRKQAMKNVALERKKKGNYGRVNLRQLPIRENVTGTPIGIMATSEQSPGSDLSGSGDSNNSESSTTTELTEYEEVIDNQSQSTRGFQHDLETSALCSTRTIPNMSSSGYEAACSRFQISVTDLSMLTNFSVGKATIYMLSADPTRLLSLLSHSQWSYLQFVPSRYNSSECLTAATDCLLAKARGVLIPFKGDRELELKLYTKALRTLQAALQDQSTCMSADVLCATQLLSLHELLEPTRAEAWSHHIQGSIRLVKYRTPDRFRSEFEKALFAAHIGPIVFESLVSDKRCYLEDSEWTGLYKSLVKDSNILDDRHPLTIGIRFQMILVPGLWHDVGKAVTDPGISDQHTTSILESRCRSLHTDLLTWRKDYTAHCMDSSLHTPSHAELAKRRELYGILLECLAVTKRLLSSICDNERLGLEPDAQSAAEKILDLQKQSSTVKHSWLFSGHEVGVAHSIISTREQWMCDDVHLSERERRLASKQRFVAWSRILRS